MDLYSEQIELLNQLRERNLEKKDKLLNFKHNLMAVSEELNQREEWLDDEIYRLDLLKYDFNFVKNFFSKLFRTNLRILFFCILQYIFLPISTIKITILSIVIFNIYLLNRYVDKKKEIEDEHINSLDEINLLMDELNGELSQTLSMIEKNDNKLKNIRKELAELSGILEDINKKINHFEQERTIALQNVLLNNPSIESKLNELYLQRVLGKEV